MTDVGNEDWKPWYLARPRNFIYFVVAWFLPLIGVVYIFHRVTHGSLLGYLAVLPAAILGVLLIVCPKWTFEKLGRWVRRQEATGEFLEKRNPPGFP